METNKNSVSSQRGWPKISLLFSIEKPVREKQQLSTAPQLLKLRGSFFPISRDINKHSRFLISPDSRFKFAFNVFSLLAVLSEVFMLPVAITYQDGLTEPMIFYVYLIEVVFLLEVFIKFNSSVYDQGVVIRDRRTIAKVYLRKNHLIADLLALFPFYFFIEGMSLSEQNLSMYEVDSSFYWKLLWLVKLCRLYKLKEVEYQIQESFSGSLMTTMSKLINFLMISLITAHLFSCLRRLSYTLALQENGSLWADTAFLLEEQYLEDFYLVIVTITSVGYGDILPSTANEKLLYIISMISACGLFGFLLGSFESLMAKYNQESGYFKSVLYQMKHYMNKIRLTKETKFKVIRYIHYLKETKGKNDLREQQVLEALSVPLREEIFSATRGFLILKSPVFQQYKNEDFAKYIGKLMKVEVYSPNDIVFQEAEKSDKMYFVQLGSVEIFHSRSQTTYKDLGKGKSFGEVGFFLEISRAASVRCLTFSELLSLKRYTLNGVLETRPKEKQTTELMLKLTKETDLSALGVRCFLCQRLGHMARDCDSFKFSINREGILEKADLRKYQQGKSLNFKVRQNDSYLRFNKKVNSIKQYTRLKNHKSSLDEKISKFSYDMKEIETREYKRKTNLKNIDEGSDSEDLSDCQSPLPVAYQYTRQFLHSKTLRSQEINSEIDSPEIYKITPENSPIKLFPIKVSSVEPIDDFQDMESS